MAAETAGHDETKNRGGSKRLSGIPLHEPLHVFHHSLHIGAPDVVGRRLERIRCGAGRAGQSVCPRLERGSGRIEGAGGGFTRVVELVRGIATELRDLARDVGYRSPTCGPSCRRPDGSFVGKLPGGRDFLIHCSISFGSDGASFRIHIDELQLPVDAGQSR